MSKGGQERLLRLVPPLSNSSWLLAETVESWQSTLIHVHSLTKPKVGTVGSPELNEYSGRCPCSMHKLPRERKGRVVRNKPQKEIIPAHVCVVSHSDCLPTFSKRWCSGGE